MERETCVREGEQRPETGADAQSRGRRQEVSCVEQGCGNKSIVPVSDALNPLSEVNIS